MNIAGIICEYNPFHNGHALHAAKTREMTRCDGIIAVMSGAFTQRGDPAVIDKWTRAKMALKCGVDIVVELPAAFAIRPADKFAWGGASIAAGLGCKWLSFASETDDVSLIKRLAAAVDEEIPELSGMIKEGLSRGLSHARARGEALADLLRVDSDIINKPNTALAIEYARANARLEKPMELVVVKRQGDYHDTTLADICSASAIRSALANGEDVSRAMPEKAYELLDERLLSDESRLDDIALYVMRNAHPESLALLPEANEGAYMLLKKHAAQAFSRRDLLTRAKCKRYTFARLNRMLTYAILGLEERRLYAITEPSYARVLGFRRRARDIMRYINENGSIPLVTDATALKGEDTFAIENMATDLWALTARNPSARTAGGDYTNQIVVETQE